MQNKVVPEDDKTQSPDQVSGYHDDDVGIVLTMLYQYHLVKQIPRQIRCVIPYFIKTVDPSHSYKQKRRFARRHPTGALPQTFRRKRKQRQTEVTKQTMIIRKPQNAKLKSTPQHRNLFPNMSGGFKLALLSYKGGPNSVSKNHISFRCKKRTPKLASCTFLSWLWQPFPFYCVDARGRVFPKHAIEALRGSARPGRGHASDAKRIGTRTQRGSWGLETI